MNWHCWPVLPTCGRNHLPSRVTTYPHHLCRAEKEAEKLRERAAARESGATSDLARLFSATTLQRTAGIAAAAATTPGPGGYGGGYGGGYTQGWSPPPPSLVGMADAETWEAPLPDHAMIAVRQLRARPQHVLALGVEDLAAICVPGRAGGGAR